MYEQELEILGAAFARRDAFLGPWSGKSIGDWSPEVRQREQAILAQAAALEAAATGQINAALAAEGVELPAASKTAAE